MRLPWLALLGVAACGGSTRDPATTDAGAGGTGGAGAGGTGGATGGAGGIQLTGGGGRPAVPSCSPLISATSPTDPPPTPTGVSAEIVEWGEAARVFVASSQEAGVSWRESTALYWRRYRAGAWLPAEAFAGGSEPELASMVVTQNGSAAAAYYEPTQGGYALCTRIVRPDGTAATETIGWTTYGWWQDPTPPIVSLGGDAAGTLVIAYRVLEHGRPDRVYARTAGGIAWSAPIEIGSGTVSFMDLGVATGGVADSIWGSPVPGVPLESAHFAAASGWTAPTALAEDVSLARLVANDATSNLAIWNRWEGSEAVIELARLTNGTLETPSVLNPPSDTSTPTLATDGAGNAILGWHTIDACSHPSKVQTRSPAGAWSAPVDLPFASLAAVDASPAVALALWRKGAPQSSGPCNPLGVFSTWLTSTNTQEQVIDASNEAHGAAAALAADGRALVAWSRADVVVAKWLDPP